VFFATNSNGNCNCYGYSNGYRNANSHSHGDAASYPNTYSRPDATSAEDIKGNQCDCQQLYCELEQHNRSDWLPARRVRQQYVWDLRAWISGTECLQRNKLQRDRPEIDATLQTCPDLT
jgi:hypothetical protein